MSDVWLSILVPGILVGLYALYYFKVEKPMKNRPPRRPQEEETDHLGEKIDKDLHDSLDRMREKQSARLREKLNRAANNPRSPARQIYDIDNDTIEFVDESQWDRD